MIMAAGQLVYLAPIVITMLMSSDDVRCRSCGKRSRRVWRMSGLCLPMSVRGFRSGAATRPT
jgi:hypothetical protein